MSSKLDRSLRVAVRSFYPSSSLGQKRGTFLFFFFFWYCFCCRSCSFWRTKRPSPGRPATANVIDDSLYASRLRLATSARRTFFYFFSLLSSVVEAADLGRCWPKLQVACLLLLLLLLLRLILLLLCCSLYLANCNLIHLSLPPSYAHTGWRSRRKQEETETNEGKKTCNF